jgi:hypothetical protein
VIAEADRRLSTWAADRVPGVALSLEAPAGGREGEGVSLYLFEVAPAAEPARGGDRLRAGLRYLVTTWAASVERAHELLGTLLTAALQEPDFEVDLQPASAVLWSAFGLVPQPSFTIRVPARQDVARAPARPVRRPLEVRVTGLAPLEGTVLGPDESPLAGANVELPALQLAAVTDWRGRFSFPAVPAEPLPKELLVRARGREQTFSIGAVGPTVLIQFGPLEA